MAEWVYEDGTPVPEEALPPELRERPSALRAALEATTRSFGPAAEPGPREAIAALGSQVAAYPAGVAAGIASLPYHVARGLDPFKNLDPWAEAKRTRHQVEEALAYQPRTPEGRETLARTAEFLEPALNPRLTQELEAGATRRYGPDVGEVVGFTAHPATLLGFPEARAVLGFAGRGAAQAAARGVARTGIPAAVRASGERAALRTLGAPGGAVGELGLRRGEAGLQEVGRTALEVPGARLAQGPRGVREPVAEAMRPVGQALETMAQHADQVGSSFDLGAVLQRFDAATQGLSKNSFARERLDKVRQYVAESAQSRGTWTPERRQLMQLSPSEAWAMRQGLDDIIFDAETGLRRKSPLRAEFNRLRGLVDNQLQGAMETAGVGSEWQQANRTYHNMADVQRLAREGFKRQLAAEYAPPGGQSQNLQVAGVRIPWLKLSSHRNPPSYRMLAAHARSAEALSRPFTF